MYVLFLLPRNFNLRINYHRLNWAITTARSLSSTQDACRCSALAVSNSVTWFLLALFYTVCTYLDLSTHLLLSLALVPCEMPPLLKYTPGRPVETQCQFSFAWNVSTSPLLWRRFAGGVDQPIQADSCSLGIRWDSVPCCPESTSTLRATPVKPHPFAVVLPLRSSLILCDFHHEDFTCPAYK